LMNLCPSSGKQECWFSGNVFDIGGMDKPGFT
jgi:hypothetical protein